MLQEVVVFMVVSNSKEDKAGSKADVVDSSTDAMNKMMTLISTQQEKLNAIIKDKDKPIRQQQGT